ncbi:MAG: glycosyltransferase family 1 protein [Chloroflexi bacterium]|nr:glycosyltransferase family 1 protein [Chloroflexota bacterium]
MPSESTRDDLQRITHVPESRVHMVPYGVSPSFRPVHAPHLRRAVAERYGLPSEFLLYVGNLEPRKNLPRLLEAYARLPGRQVVPPLVLAGTRGWKDAPLRETMERLNLGRRVVFPGYIPQEDLPAVYSMAAAFVYPSLYEGFGLPVLEAMACGTPVITSNVSSMPEVAGDAALLVSPNDVEGLTRALDRVLGEPDLRAELSRRGLARARQFTWRRAAESTLAVYRSVLGTV